MVVVVEGGGYGGCVLVEQVNDGDDGGICRWRDDVGGGSKRYSGTAR